MKSPIRIAIIGRGNVATHLQKALAPYADCRMVNSRTLENFPHDCDVAIISVSDNAIVSTAERLNTLTDLSGKVVAHTSGTTPMEALRDIADSYGVFYPLQTFSKEVALDYQSIPFFIEGNGRLSVDTLTRLASMITNHVYEADSDKRRQLHIASVLSCNFVNHLWALSEKYLTENGLSFDMLHPLIQETLRKAVTSGPGHTQTGPAVRHDSRTIDAHLSMLHKTPELQNLYAALSQSIENMYPAGN